jgi:ArsR family metal-binding transcriptional regulator
MLVWRKKLTTCADVISTIRKILDYLSRVFPNDLYAQKSNVVFLHIYDSYMGECQSVYQQLPITQPDPTRKCQKKSGANVIADP